MNYHDFGITREQRDVLQGDIAELRPYILAIKQRELGQLKCESCGQSEAPIEIHHKRYGIDVNYYDLMLLCKDCHDKLRDNSKG